MQPSDPSGKYRKAGLVLIGLLASLGVLGYMFLLMLGAAMGGSKIDASYGFWFLVAMFAALFFAAWTVMAFIEASQKHKKSVSAEAANPQKGSNTSDS